MYVRLIVKTVLAFLSFEFREYLFQKFDHGFIVSTWQHLSFTQKYGIIWRKCETKNYKSRISSKVFMLPIYRNKFVLKSRIFVFHHSDFICTRQVHFYLHMNLFHFVDKTTRRREMFRVAHNFSRCFSSGDCFVRAHETRSIRKQTATTKFDTNIFLPQFFQGPKKFIPSRRRNSTIWKRECNIFVIETQWNVL